MFTTKSNTYYNIHPVLMITFWAPLNLSNSAVIRHYMSFICRNFDKNEFLFLFIVNNKKTANSSYYFQSMTNVLEISTERTPLKLNQRSVDVESEMSENSSAPKPEMDDTKRIILKIVIDFVALLLGEY